MAASACAFGGSETCPARITDRVAPGLSTMYTTDLDGSDTVETFFVGTGPDFQPSNNASNFGVSSASVVSPVTTSVEFFGRNHVPWKVTKSSRVIVPTLAVVPDPVKGLPYAWPEP